MSTDRLREANQIRVAAAEHQLLDTPPDPILKNADESNAALARFEGSFTKLLAHDDRGVLTDPGVGEFKKLAGALDADDPAGIEDVKLAQPPNPNRRRRAFINPRSAFSYEELGADVGQVGMPAPPTLGSRWAACEMLEVYGAALLRDVPFNDYQGASTHPSTEIVSQVLQAFEEDYLGPKQRDGDIPPRLLFRGTTEGDRRGPFISQFLLLPFFPLFPSGCAPFVGELIGVGNLDLDSLRKEQQYFVPSTREFMTTEETFAAVQNGEIPESYQADDFVQRRRDYEEAFLNDGRALGGLVHVDSPYEAYYNALNILGFRGSPFSPAFPYSSRFAGTPIGNQTDGHTMGPPDAYTLMPRACIAAFKAAWAHKWRGYRRLRPEAMGARVHFTLKDIDLEDAQARDAWVANASDPKTNPYQLHPDLVRLGWPLLKTIQQRPQNNRTLLLTQMYPEGSPAHPAYPSGHATVAGACTTILKAMFDDRAPLPELPAGDEPRGYVQVNRRGRLVDFRGNAELTIGGELDKLASNISHGRDFGGVHYRSDGDEGLALGEQVALRVLMDHVRTYPEPGFKGFQLTLRNGRRVRVTAEDVIDQ